MEKIDQLAEWCRRTFWRRRDHVAESTGTQEAGLPVVLNSLGKLAVSLLTPIVGALTVNGEVVITGDTSATAKGFDNIRFGNVSGSPRIIIEDAGFTQWMIDALGGTWRLFITGVVKLSHDGTTLTILDNAEVRKKLTINAATIPFNDAGGLATFLDDAGREITIGGLGIFRRDNNGNADLRINFLGYQGGTTQFRDVDIYDGKSNLLARFDGSEGAFYLYGNFGAWTNLTFGTGWGDFGAGFQGGQYRKIGDMVYLRGLVARTAGVGTTITTLPSLHRPPATMLFDVQSNDALGRLDISTAGVVTLATGSGTWVNLSDIPPFSVI